MRFLVKYDKNNHEMCYIKNLRLTLRNLTKICVIHLKMFKFSTFNSFDNDVQHSNKKT